uniref:Uncharacterized protein n=1 Tax=Arundo donax TaxID=35708 RepID=A0A0A9A5N3_ARUDO
MQCSDTTIYATHICTTKALHLIVVTSDPPKLELVYLRKRSTRVAMVILTMAISQPAGVAGSSTLPSQRPMREVGCWCRSAKLE